jgi:HlyD family secretion protein
MKPRLSHIAVALVAVAVLAMAVSWVLFVRPLAVATAAPEMNVPVEVFGLGTVEARVLSKVGFEVDGALGELYADHGDRVTKGAVLARLMSGEQQAKLAEARAKVSQAEASLRQAQAQVRKSEATLTQRRQVNERRQALVKRGTVSEEAAQDSQAEAEVAAAELALATSQVEVARASLEDAKAREQLETVVLRQHALAAPYDSLVVQRHAELGVVLGPGQALFTLIDPATVWVKAHVDEALAGGLAVGQPAAVRLRSLPRQAFAGRVVRIDIESDRVSEERRVYVRCETCPADFHLGEQAEVLITTATLARALLIPELAVDELRGSTGVVWTVEDGRLRRRAVTFGERTLDGRLEIAGGLPQGARAVTRLAGGLSVGRAARASDGGGR